MSIKRGVPETDSTQSGTPTEKLHHNNINVGVAREGSDIDLPTQVSKTDHGNYHIHLPTPTHKLTRSENIERQMKGTALHGVERHD